MIAAVATVMKSDGTIRMEINLATKTLKGAVAHGDYFFFKFA